MKTLISNGLIDEMIAKACKLASSKGLKTRNEIMLKKAEKNEFLSVKNGRIFPTEEAMQDCLKHIQTCKVPKPNIYGGACGWEGMVVNHSENIDTIIKLTDLPYQYCDYQNRKIIPLTRKHVIEGTKLLQILAEEKNVLGNSCGVPQDTADPLKAIEQYLIGFRYNRNGGSTIQSVAVEVETAFSKIRAIAEDWIDPNQRSLMLFSPSPLLLDSEDLYLCFKSGIRISSILVGSMPMMGMTGPVDPIGVYVLGLAEVLGGAAILHALLPEADIFVYPHPQAMDPRTGQMAFGTVEHARLEMIKIQVMKALNLPYYNLKDIMTSAQMPGSMAQGDKALGFFTGLMAGYKAFNLMPLSTDQVWSPVQALLDVEALQNAVSAIQPLEDINSTENIFQTIDEVIENNGLFGESMDTLINLHENYQTNVLHNRYQSSEAWNDAGRLEELSVIENKKEEMISRWNYHPDQEKLDKILPVYYQLCKKYSTDPLKLD